MEGIPHDLQCIRAGVRGYLPRDASAEDVMEAVRPSTRATPFVPARSTRRCFAMSSAKPPPSLLGRLIQNH